MPMLQCDRFTNICYLCVFQSFCPTISARIMYDDKSHADENSKQMLRQRRMNQQNLLRWSWQSQIFTLWEVPTAQLAATCASPWLLPWCTASHGGRSILEVSRYQSRCRSQFVSSSGAYRACRRRLAYANKRFGSLQHCQLRRNLECFQACISLFTDEKITGKN